MSGLQLELRPRPPMTPGRRRHLKRMIAASRKEELAWEESDRLRAGEHPLTLMRERLGLDVAELAQAVGLSPAGLADIEAFRQEFPAEVLGDVAGMLVVSREIETEREKQGALWAPDKGWTIPFWTEARGWRRVPWPAEHGAAYNNDILNGCDDDARGAAGWRQVRDVTLPFGAGIQVWRKRGAGHAWLFIDPGADNAEVLVAEADWSTFRRTILRDLVAELRQTSRPASLRFVRPRPAH